MSLGMDCNAASSVMAKNGMPHHTLAMIGPHSACCGSDNKLSGVFINPAALNQYGSGPTTGLNNQAQLSADKKLGTAHGRKTSNCTGARPLKGRASSKASTSPKENCRTTDAPVQVTVFLSAFQKLASA